jgi:hypothetical protein
MQFLCTMSTVEVSAYTATMFVSVSVVVYSACEIVTVVYS